MVDLQQGGVRVEDVPVPLLRKGVIVENRYSLISGGTELSLITLSQQSLLGKARSRPDDLKKVLSKVKTDGLLSAYQQAMSRLGRPEPLGYSSAGIVRETSVDEFRAGDRVACAGAGYAVHAEFVSVPKNLCVPVPEGVSMQEAAFTTVGAIALHGVRNARVHLGESVAVIGLGLIGLLTVQILKAAGCRVFGVEIDSEKARLARELGADVTTGYDGILERMKNFSPFGADAVIITAATKSNLPIESAGHLVRDRGRVVVVGNVGMNVSRDTFYEKEAELIVSRSYGPGRYDRIYEEKGVDYPIYVRWTERRNMEAFLELVRSGNVNIKPLITHEFPLENALQAYGLMMGGREKYIGILLGYGENGKEYTKRIALPAEAASSTKVPADVGNLGCIGAGVHAMSALYPELARLPVHLRGLATATGVSAHSVAKKYGFAYCTTDYRSILEDPEIDSVLIATRNDLHAAMAVEALSSGKNVFVEKPLATTPDELRQVVRAWKEHGGRLMVGFNRRHSSLSGRLKQFFAGRNSPMIIHYRVNAGQIPADHWVHDAEQGGGMLISECCHFIDFMQYLTDARPATVFARSIDPGGGTGKYDNVQMTLTFDDGSLGSITYTTLGDGSYSKEMVEVFCSNAVGRITDFRELELWRGGRSEKARRWLSRDKGFHEELSAFIAGDLPDFAGSVCTTAATFRALESIESGKPLAIDLQSLGL
ncbi:putative zinc-binding dehydrogenase [hydrocarbon metagenome]|uniref:Putative zinc-binding dehydrogenase n=1 Tax=hydrocarbon metagenome TaxID=938273 RepID=A0A0W8FJS1_9ZZZZ